MQEHGKIVILGKSVDSYEPKPVPFKPVGWCHNRLVVKELEAIIEVSSPSTAKVIPPIFV
jgi:hypothetical protein